VEDELFELNKMEALKPKNTQIETSGSKTTPMKTKNKIYKPPES